MINSQFNRIRKAAAAAAMAAAVTFAAPMAALPAFAATGTVTGSDINVRSEAGSDSSQVGTVTTGDVVTVGETATDSSGATWYQVTLENGTVGYVRGDFLTVDESADEESTDAATDESAETTDASTEAQSTDAAAADAAAAAEQDTGGYQIVLAPDADGADTYYLYDNNEGKRMKISDIQKLEDDVTTAQTAASSAKRSMIIVAFALGAVAMILLIAVIVLIIKLKDALENGRKERDLTMERRDQRRVDHRADSVESLRRPRGEQASRRGRDDAYASNARRVSRDLGAEDRTQRRTARPAESGNYTTRTRTAAPARDTEGRPAARQQAVRSTAAERPARSAAAERPVRSAEPRSTETTAARRPAQQQAPRQAAKTTIADEDFDYDFLKLDDGE